jgi:hypothetical protein
MHGELSAAVSGSAAVAHKIVDIGKTVGEKIRFSLWMSGGFRDKASFAKSAELSANLIARHASNASDSGNLNRVPGQGDSLENALLLDGQSIHNCLEILQRIRRYKLVHINSIAQYNICAMELIGCRSRLCYLRKHYACPDLWPD